jgi:hypothetical protein
MKRASILMALLVGFTLQGCVEQTTTAEAPRQLNQREAAVMLADQHCANESCRTALVEGWCGVDGCQASVEDLSLFDQCMEKLEPVCWKLFQ